jgi:hypothetical protein
MKLIRMASTPLTAAKTNQKKQQKPKKLQPIK